MGSRPRHALPLIITALLAMLCLVRGSLHPGMNYDVVPYVALAKQLRGTGGKAEAYQEVAARVGSSRFQQYVTGPYRERMYRDDAYFRANQSLYTIRPLYILLSAALGSLIHDDVAATYLISALATALAVLVSFVLAGKAGLEGNWRLAVPLTWVVAGGLNMAGLSTPDGLETLLCLLFVQVTITSPWGVPRTVCLSALAVLMVATRTDAVLLLTFLMALEWQGAARNRALSVLPMVAAWLAYGVIQKSSGNYGYIALINFALLENGRHEVFPNLVPDPKGYVSALTHQVLQVLGEHVEFALLSLSLSLLAFTWCCERRWRSGGEADAFNQRALILSAALFLSLIARFVLFPLPWSRYVMGTYVLTGILFARVIPGGRR